MSDALTLFSPPVADWFRSTFGQPTPPQEKGWPAIARGEHALIVSPTGSGKTLTAFLWALDALHRELGETPETAKRSQSAGYRPGVRVLYVSPLKALNNDVERNLERPLIGIRRQIGEAAPTIRVGVRTGDTPGNERQRMSRRPPQILITTPESLYLLLTAEGSRGMFETTHTVIVDEIHTLIGSKRGAHLALSLERLERLTARSPQRIGLSATVRPIENAARFLGGQSDGQPRPVTLVDAAARKQMDLQIVGAVEDMSQLPGGSIWPHVVPRVTDLVDQHRTTLVFCNSRRMAERTADRLNEQRLVEAGAQPAPTEKSFHPGSSVFGIGADSERMRQVGLEPIRAHHGSMSKAARLEMEAALKSGQLPALVATSSLELGIDIGDIDLVVHVQSPKSVASGLQRVGRSGHLVGQTPKGRIFPTHAEDVVEAAAVVHGMLHGEIEETHTPENPLDVLAQQVMAMASVEDWDYDELFALVRSAHPYRSLSEPAFRSVLEMLSGKYPDHVSRYLHARLSWDRVNNRLAALPGSRMLAVRSGGTIPDRGTFTLVTGERRTKVGELDEEFVFETRKGDVFVLGSQIWRVTDISDDRVVAEPAPGETPRMPFWRGDFPWRPFDLGKRIGAFKRRLADMVGALTVEDLAGLRDEEPPEKLREVVAFLRDECALDRSATVQLVTHVWSELDHVGRMASDRTIVAELYEDGLGEPRLVVHSPFGGRVNGPWAIALAGAIRERYGIEVQTNVGDDGILFRFPAAETEPPADLVAQVTAQEARERLINDLPDSPVFGAQFRMNAARALVLPRTAGGKRTPLWLSRLRAKDLQQAVMRFGDFPIVLETYRDCLRDVMDLDGLTQVLEGIARGEIEVVVHRSEVPSPLAAGLDYRFAMQYMYEYDAPRGEKQLAALTLNRGLLADLLQDGSLADLLRPEAVAEVSARAARTLPEARVRSTEELAQMLYELGDLTGVEIAERSASERYPEWIRSLASRDRIVEREIGGQTRWVSAERAAEYDALESSPLPLLRRWLAHAGSIPPERLAARYGLDPTRVRELLPLLGPEVAAGQFGEEERWVDRRALEQMHRRTLAILRNEVQPVPLHAYAAFLREHQHGHTALTGALQQLRGLAVPGVAWERDVLPSRLQSFDPAELAKLCGSGELMWVAQGGKDPGRARVSFFFRGEGQLFLDRAPPETELSDDAAELLAFLREEGAALLPDLVEGTGMARDRVEAALVELTLGGLTTNDSLAALHGLMGYEPPPSRRPTRQRSSLEAQLAELLPPGRQRPLTRHRLREAKRNAREAVHAVMRSSPAGRPVSDRWAGRWSLVHRTALLGRTLPDEELWTRRARQLLARWGVVSRACLERESPVLAWEMLYPALARLEMRGEVRRGYFVDGLAGAQFALPETIDRLRAVNGARLDAPPTVLSAVDPAQLFGTEEWGGPLRFARVASAAVGSQAGEPVAVMEDSGASLNVAEHPATVPALRELAAWWVARLPGRLKVARYDDAALPLLEAAGFVRDYGGMLWVPR